MRLPLARAAAPLAVLLILSASLLTGCSDDEPDSSDDDRSSESTTDSGDSAEPSGSPEPTSGAAEGCDLITPAEAEEILGGTVEDPLESPPTVECQYISTGGGGTLDLYKGETATTVLETQEGADPDFGLEPLDGVGEEAQLVSFAGCGGVYFRTSDDTWWFLSTVCDTDEWVSQTSPAMIDLATTIVSRLEP